MFGVCSGGSDWCGLLFGTSWPGVCLGSVVLLGWCGLLVVVGLGDFGVCVGFGLGFGFG